ncbi:MAG: murein L,D-transpeptidase catalytic domain-containing protein [Pseudobdellovibrionaceae bacterium]
MLKTKKPNSLFSRFSTTLLITASVLAVSACAGNKNSAALPDDPSHEAVSPQNPQQQVPAEAAPISSTDISSSEKDTILKGYDYVDPNHVVPYKALEEALVYFYQNKSRFTNSDYMSVINFGQNSKEKRFYIINMKTGAVWAIHVAHGKGSDENHDGWADKFSNASGSNASSLGIYRTAETYDGEHGLSLRLDGLSTTNSNVRSRSIVIHGASYVQEANVIQGRSWGCPAVTMGYRDTVVKYLKNGSMIYATVDKGGTERPSQPKTSTESPAPTTSTPSPVSAINNPAPTTSTTDAAPSAPSTPSTFTMSPLAWETSSHPERKQWSQYLEKIILENWNSLLTGASDISYFCPKYGSLDNDQKANVWAQLFVGIVKFESAYDPHSRMRETTMGIDPVTRKPIYSEGLLQLSYQDQLVYKFCKFDWSKDKNLSATDRNKTILDPYINLDCGVGIMAKQIARTGKIKVGSGAYWSTLKTNSSNNEISNITAMVRSFPLCR